MKTTPTLLNCTFFAMLIGLSAACCGQDPSATEDATFDFQIGSFKQISDPMGRVIQLELKENRLLLRRNWQDEWNRKKSQWTDAPDALCSEFSKTIKKRGLHTPDSFAQRLLYFLYQDQDQELSDDEREYCLATEKKDEERFSHLHLEHGESNASYIALDIAVMGLAGSLGKRHLGGHGGSTKMRRTRFSGEQMYAEHMRMGDVLRFNFVENEKPFRGFSLSDPGNGGLFLRYSANDLIVDLAQQADGRVRLVIITNGEPEVYSSNNFAELAKAHTQPVSGILLPLLTKLGITTSNLPK